MIREEYLRRIVDACYVDLYLSATDGARIYWPWRMQPVHEAGKRHRNACEQYVVDSSFAREDIGNEDVLDRAAALDAEVAVLADVYQDKDATVDALREGLALAEEHRFDGTLMLPLQAPHAECYRELADDAPDDVLWAIGGVKDAGDDTKVEAARSVREIAPDIHLHGLGFGVTDTLAEAVREDPDLLDSVDYSTPVQNAMNTPTPPGDERMSVVAARAGAELINDARRLSPFATDPQPEDLRERGQEGLEGFA